MEVIGHLRTHKRDCKIKHICSLTPVLRMEMLTKKTISLHLKVAILKNIFDNFDTYLKISNAHVHRCKMFHLNFRFVARFLYVLGLFSYATHLLASSPNYEIAQMTSYIFYNTSIQCS